MKNLFACVVILALCSIAFGEQPRPPKIERSCFAGNGVNVEFSTYTHRRWPLKSRGPRVLLTYKNTRHAFPLVFGYPAGMPLYGEVPKLRGHDPNLALTFYIDFNSVGRFFAHYEIEEMHGPGAHGNAPLVPCSQEKNK